MNNGKLSTHGHLSFDEWKALGPEGAAEHSARNMGWDSDRKEKLKRILIREWGNGEEIDGEGRK